MIDFLFANAVRVNVISRKVLITCLTMSSSLPCGGDSGQILAQKPKVSWFFAGSDFFPHMDLKRVSALPSILPFRDYAFSALPSVLPCRDYAFLLLLSRFCIAYFLKFSLYAES